MTRESIISRRLFAIFLLGCLLFNYPLVSLFNLNTFWLGVPLLYLYMFTVWILLIILVVFVTRFGEKNLSATNRRPGRRSR